MNYHTWCMFAVLTPVPEKYKDRSSQDLLLCQLTKFHQAELPIARPGFTASTLAFELLGLSHSKSNYVHQGLCAAELQTKGQWPDSF